MESNVQNQKKIKNYKKRKQENNFVQNETLACPIFFRSALLC